MKIKQKLRHNKNIKKLRNIFCFDCPDINICKEHNPFKCNMAGP